jgi:hypothetical protein
MIKTDFYPADSRIGSAYLSRPERVPAPPTAGEDQSGDRSLKGPKRGTAVSEEAALEGQLSPQERKELEELKKADREVRRHERAHISAAAGIAVSGAQFTFEMGPDGRLYAVSGEVRIDTSEVPGDPAATIEKMKRVRRAALAPQDPSTQDRRVAAEASAREQQARLELARNRNSGQYGDETGDGATAGKIVDVTA